MIDELRQLITDYPDSLNEKKRFRALLFDYFQVKKKESNAIYMAYEAGIPKDMQEKSRLTEVDKVRYEKLLSHTYGMEKELIYEVIEAWATVLTVEMEQGLFAQAEISSLRDDDIYNRVKDIEDTDLMIKTAFIIKFTWLKKNYRKTAKHYSDIIVDLMRYDTDKAMEVWIWMLRTFWGRLPDEPDDSYYLIRPVMFDLSDIGKMFVHYFEIYPDFLMYLYEKAKEITSEQTEILYEMMKQDKLEMFLKAWHCLMKNREEDKLNMDEIVEALIDEYRAYDETDIPTQMKELLEAEIEGIEGDIIRSNLTKKWNEKKEIRNERIRRQQEQEERHRQMQERIKNQKPKRAYQKWDFAALKEKAVANRKDDPMWNGYKFISFTTVVGLYYREDKEEILQDMKVGDKLSLRREPDNEYDSMAVAVHDPKERKIGYLPKESNTFMSTMMDSGQEFIARLYDFQRVNDNANIAIEIFMK